MIPKFILITGGAGFVGQAIAQFAKAQGHHVSLLDLPEKLAEHHLEGIGCDILDQETLNQALLSHECVIHCAANPNLWSRFDGDLYEINYQGTLNVIEACQKAKISELIHISSDCTLIGKHHDIVNEDSQTKLSDMKGAYCKSKWLAECAVIKANDDQLKTMVINPGVPIGRTSQQAPFTQMLKAFLEGKIKGTVEGHIGLIDVDDIALCTLKALDQNAWGQKFLAVSETWHLDKLFEIIAKQTQTQAPSLHVPFWVAQVAASVDEISATITGGRVPLATRAGLYLAQHTHTIDASQTQQSLNIQFKPIEPALIQMLTSLQKSSI